MSTSESLPLCNCPTITDSALSTAANILSILTFAYIVLLELAFSLVVRWSTDKMSTHESLRTIVIRISERARTVTAEYPEYCKIMIDTKWDEAQAIRMQLADEAACDVRGADGGGERWYHMWRPATTRKKRRAWKRQAYQIEYFMSLKEQEL